MKGESSDFGSGSNISETTKSILIAAAYFPLKSTKLSKYASDLPAVCPRILLSRPAGSEIYQGALSKALAKHFSAKILIVEGLVLPGGPTMKKDDISKGNPRPEKTSIHAKHAVSTTLKLKKPASGVEADITIGPARTAQLPKNEAWTASSRQCSFKEAFLTHLHCNPWINTFRVCFGFDSSDAYARHIDKWVRFAILKKVKNLDLDLISLKPLYTLTFDVLKPSLDLNDSGIRFLQSLYLNKVNVNEDILEYLLAECRALERLHVKCSHPLLRLKVVSLSRKLKHLTILHCMNVKVEIEAVNLLYLHVANDSPNFFRFMNFSSNNSLI